MSSWEVHRKLWVWSGILALNPGFLLRILTVALEEIHFFSKAVSEANLEQKAWVQG